MSKLTYKVSYYVLYAIFAATVVVMALFYFGGEMAVPLVPEVSSNPVHTDTLLYLMYALLGLAVLVTIVAFILQFAAALKDNPVAALKSLVGLIVIVLLAVITWSMGSEEPLVIAGYEGKENVPFWLKLTDMFLYSLYFLIATCVVAMIGSSVKKALS